MMILPLSSSSICVHVFSVGPLAAAAPYEAYKDSMSTTSNSSVGSASSSSVVRTVKTPQSSSAGMVTFPRVATSLLDALTAVS